MKKLAFLFLIVLISGCATSGDFELLREDLANAKRESLELKKELESLREKTAGALRDINEIREKAASAVKEDSFAAVRENQAEINLRLSDISNSLQDLRGRFEENKYNLEKTFRDSATERDMLKAQIAAMETQLKVVREKLAITEELPRGKEPVKKPAGDLKSDQEKAISQDEQEQAKPEPPLQEESAEKKAYDSAYQAFNSKKFKEAREKFNAFIKEYSGSKLTDNAQFWIAESFYAEKDFESAILAYETLLKKYPESKKTAGALLKQGFAFIEIGDLKTGRTILKKLTEKYPDSREAALAKKRLAEIEKKPGRKK